MSLFISVVIPGLTASAQKKDSKPVNINFLDIIGKWTYLQTKPNINIQKAQVKQETFVSDTAKTKPANRTAIPLDKNKFREWHKASLTFNNTSLEFLSGKKLIKTRSDTVTYSWKKSGNNFLNLKNLKTNEKTRFEVRTLNSDTLQLAEYFDVGSLYFFYLRAK